MRTPAELWSRSGEAREFFRGACTNTAQDHSRKHPAMICSTRATRTERWSSSLTFELDVASTANDAASGSQQGANSRRRARRPFASASAALSEGVGAKAAASYSPPPPKPKVGASFVRRGSTSSPLRAMCVCATERT